MKETSKTSTSEIKYIVLAPLTYVRGFENAIFRGCPKKWMFLILLLCPVAAFGNPTADPVTNVSFIIVVASALGVETAIITVILFFCHMNPGRLFLALLLGNLAIYLVIFRPILFEVDNLLIAEAVIVAADGAYIKLLSTFATFQMDDFKGLKWRTAFICAAAGNILSYAIGTIIGA